MHLGYDFKNHSFCCGSWAKQKKGKMLLLAEGSPDDVKALMRL